MLRFCTISFHLIFTKFGRKVVEKIYRSVIDLQPRHLMSGIRGKQSKSKQITTAMVSRQSSNEAGFERMSSINEHMISYHNEILGRYNQDLLW